NAFSSSHGDAGNDINVNPVYERDITGEGIRIAVSDTGAEINHDDLYQNLLSGKHKNYTLDAPYYGTPVASDAHGTAVSSLIGAKGWNNEGSMGVAPNAKLAVFQFLMGPGSSSVLIDQASGDFDIFNYSYGDYQPYDVSSDSFYVDHLRDRVKNGRGGLGSFFVKAAGNEHASSCFPHNANAPWENELPYIIVTGAVDAYGERSKYSNAGSNLWVSAPGGSYGYDDSGPGNEPAIMAADLPTCFKGYSKASPYQINAFEYGHSLNPKCNYTSTMNGTSASAPIVSGVIALMLEQNPNLGWRDVKHILASTAKKVDAFTNAWPYRQHPSNYLGNCNSYNLSGHVYEQGWVQNSTGISFNNYYGFGAVDADAAVKMAQDPSTNARGDWLPMPAMVETNPYFVDTDFSSGTLDKTIPDADPDGVTDIISVGVNENIPVTSSFVVESVQVKVSVTHDFSGEVGVELVSPSDTKSILLNINNSFLNPKCDENDNNCRIDKNLNITLTSHAFYGESAIGDWTLKVIDGMDQDEGKLTGWKLNILGHNP
ncbi:MAG: S8 family serine peptidase, partial [Bacteriovoracaceae bacterium]